MLYKFIDEHTIKKYDGKHIHYNGMIHTNPPVEVLKAVGYKELEKNEPPEYDPETQYLEATYKSGKTITVTYKIHDIEVEDE